QAELEETVAAPGLAVVVALRRRARQDFDLALVKTEALIDRRDLRLLGTTDVRGATAAFAGFERPEGFSWANPEGAHNFLGRLSGAQDALSKFGSTA
ncbi:hypothetical protein EN869_034060, partial [Mesorhizobium sp. M2D.F.Ca.ET.226.01.1.1]